MGNLLDLFVFKYNRTDFHELNLDWLISDVRTLAETLKNFVNLNSIKFADPLQWNISKQYKAITVVVDPGTGIAYLSSQPVPSGVPLSNTDYWTPIFNLNIAAANNNITLRDDGNNILSTFTSNAGDWLLWNGTLYRVSQAIALNEAYVVGYNLDRYTVEMFISDYIDAVKAAIGDLADLETTNKDSIVEAVNELAARPNSPFVNVRDFGAVGDAVYYDKTSNKYYSDAAFTTDPTNDVTAFENAIAYAVANNIHVVYIPSGYYYLPEKSFNLSDSGVTFKGDTNSFLVSAGLTSGSVFIDYEMGMTNTEYLQSPVTLEGLTLLGSYFTNNVSDVSVIGLSLHGNWQQRRSINNVAVAKFSIGINFVNSCENHIEHCAVALCNIGIRFASLTGYNPIPAYITESMIEMCARGIYAPNGGYSEIYINDSGLAGGRQIFAGKAQLYINNCRSEIGLDDCCDNSGNPVYPIHIYGTEASDSNSGINISNSEFLTEDYGYQINCGFFVDVPHYTRNSKLDAYIYVNNPYNTSAADAVIDNCMYTIGAQPVVKLIRANRIKQNNIRTTIYDGKAPLIGQNIIPIDLLGNYDSNVSPIAGAGVINVTSESAIDLPIDANDSVVITRFVPTTGTATIKHEYFIDNTSIGEKSMIVSATPARAYDNNAASDVIKGANKVRIKIPVGYYIYDTGEYNYTIEKH